MSRILQLTRFREALALALIPLCACGDFRDFDNRTSPDPSRRIIIKKQGPVLVDGSVVSQDGGSPADATGGPGCGMTPTETDVFNRTNQERQTRSLAPYTCHSVAVRVARTYSELMCSANHFDHVGPDGSTPASRLSAAGVGWSRVAENIARGQTSPAQVMGSWMQSPGHQANILDSKLTHLGVGYAPCSGKHFWTQLFLVPK